MSRCNYKNALIPILVLILGTRSKSPPDGQSWTGFLRGINDECKYDGCLHESAS